MMMSDERKPEYSVETFFFFLNIEELYKLFKFHFKFSMFAL